MELFIQRFPRTLFRQTASGMDARMSQYDLGGNAIVYRYPGGELDILCSSDGFFLPDGWEEAERFDRIGKEKPKPGKREAGKVSEGEDMLRSVRRARAQLRRLALSNSFQYFVTLTLDAEKIDRFDGKAITRALNTWCDNMVRRHGLRYVLVPERHKDGAFHFHGFFAGDGLQAVDSGTLDMDGWKHPRKPRSAAERQRWLDAGARIVYNLPQWKLGFTTAIKLYGEYSHAVGYVCKYVGKQEGQRPLGRWYFSGGALRHPEKEVYTLDYRQLKENFGRNAVELAIPGQSLLVIHTKEEERGSEGSGTESSGSPGGSRAAGQVDAACGQRDGAGSSGLSGSCGSPGRDGGLQP